MRRRAFKWILIFAIGVTALYVPYELHFKFIINDYQISLIEKRLVKNYEKHSQELLELTTLIKKFKNFEITFPSDERLSLTIDNIGVESYEEAIMIFIEGDSINLYDMNLQLEDVEQIISHSVLFDTLEVPDWRVDYSGTINSPIASTLLNSRGIDESKLSEIIKKLQMTNCIGIVKTDDRIEVRFKGHKFDSFNYVYLKNSNNPPGLNKLTENFFWEHHKSDLYCNWTNWGWI